MELLKILNQSYGTVFCITNGAKVKIPNYIMGLSFCSPNGKTESTMQKDKEKRKEEVDKITWLTDIEKQKIKMEVDRLHSIVLEKNDSKIYYLRYWGEDEIYIQFLNSYGYQVGSIVNGDQDFFNNQLALLQSKNPKVKALKLKGCPDW